MYRHTVKKVDQGGDLTNVNDALKKFTMIQIDYLREPEN